MTDQELISRAKKIFIRTTLKTEIFTYLLPVPIIAYFAFIAFTFAKAHFNMFLLVVGIAVVLALSAGLIIRYYLMKPIINSLKNLENGKEDAELIKKSKYNAYKLPIIEGLIIFLRWVVTVNLIVLLPFRFISNFPNHEFIVLNLLVILTGLASIPFYFLISEKECSDFLKIEAFEKYYINLKKVIRIKLSTKIILTVLFIISYPTFIMLAFFLLSINGELDLVTIKEGLWILVCEVIILSISVAFLLKNNIKNNLSNTMGYIDEVIEGNLNKRLPILVTDELGDLSEKLNDFFKLLHQVINKSKEISENNEIASNHLLSQFDKNSEIISDTISFLISTNNQIQKQSNTVINAVANIEELINSIEVANISFEEEKKEVIKLSEIIDSLYSSINTVSETTNNSEIITNELFDKANVGGESIKKLLTSINDISNSSSTIKDMVQIISSISEQTNLLAMNAAIEAAHAGEYGKGFSVVADEIRKLAEESKNSADTITKVIKNVTNLVGNSVIISKNASGGLEVILNKVSETKNINSKITSAMKKQSDFTNEIIDSMFNLNKSVEKLSEIAKEEKSESTEVGKVLSELQNNNDEIVKLSEIQKDKSQSLIDANDKLIELVKNNIMIGEELKNLLQKFTT